MIKILVTGFRDGPFTDRLQLEANPNDSSLFAVWKGLRSWGMQLDVRPVTPGEDVTGYDAILVGMADARAWGTKPLLGALWCLALEKVGGPHCIAFFTHWKMKEIFGGLRWLAKDESRLFDGFIKYDGADEARRHEELLRSALDDLNGGDWPATAVNAWQWADGKRMAKSHGAPFDEFELLYDPTSLMSMPKMDPPTVRERAWVMGTHENHDRWIGGMGLTWPVEHYGAKRSGSPRGLLPKADLLRRHSECWGALVPPYRTSGDGYWRARIMHAADRLAVACGAPQELLPFGYSYYPPISEVESMSDSDLIDLAMLQNAHFRASITPPDLLRMTLYRFVEDVARAKRRKTDKMPTMVPMTTGRTLFDA